MSKETNTFVFDESKAKLLVKRAKRNSLLKIIGLIIVITPIVVFLLLYSLNQLTAKSGHNIRDEIRLFHDISGPNVQISNQTASHNLLGGEIKTHTYKVINDRPYIWETIEGQFNLFGTYTMEYDIQNPIKLDGSDSLKNSNQIDVYNSHTGDREMQFYHPDIKYDALKQDVQQLEQLENKVSVEMALSFDQAYSLSDIEYRFPKDVKLVWWWVDTFSDSTIAYMSQEQDIIRGNSPFIYGFHKEQALPKQRQSANTSNNEIKGFIEKIETLRTGDNFKWQVEQVYDVLVGEDGVLNEGDVKIIGAVVTGSPKQLSTLQGLPFIRASAYGVITTFN